MIELKDVSKRYGEGKVAVTALRKINLSVAPGEFVVVLGPSGSGKTTLLNTIGAVDVATEGVVGGRCGYVPSKLSSRCTCPPAETDSPR